MTFYEVSVVTRWRIGCGVAAAAIVRRTERSTSAGPFRRRARGWPACCSADFLRREIKRDPQSARSWRRQLGQADGDI
jgi:hypothetical protein